MKATAVTTARDSGSFLLTQNLVIFKQICTLFTNVKVFKDVPCTSCTQDEVQGRAHLQ